MKKLAQQAKELYVYTVGHGKPLKEQWSDLHFYKGSLCQLLRQRQIRAEGEVGKTGGRKAR